MSKPKISTHYPGAPRIVLKMIGKIESADKCMIKVFGSGSARSHTRNQSRLGIISTHPIEKLIIDRSGKTNASFIDAIKAAAETLSIKHRCTIWDERGWWKIEDGESDFNDPIPF
mgnify:CR=1 FL=1